MKFSLLSRDEHSEEVFDSLDLISTDIEGIDWISGNYEVRDENGVEYEAEWIKKPSEKRFLFFFRIVDIGS